jgi:hypothetical protein
MHRNYHILSIKIYHMKCKKGGQQGGAGRGAWSSRERSKERQKTCEESLMGRTGQKKSGPNRKN